MPRKAAPRQLAIEYRPLAELKPYARNARTHTPAQITKIRESLAKYGWTNPMLIADNGMIAGHARLIAAIQMAEQGQPIRSNEDPWAGPTVDLSHLSGAERKAYILADNRLALDAGWDNELLRLEFTDLKVSGFDLALTGFDAAQVGDILKGTGGEAPDTFVAYGEDIEVDHKCPRCGYVFSGGKVIRRLQNDEEAA